ncbi:MAG: acyl-CoA dehydrogenase family protein [Pseudomonadota bacterium]
MDFSLTDDRRMVADTLSRFLRDSYGPELRNKIAHDGPGYALEIWAKMAELGIVGALVPEAAGGFGGSGFDIAVVFEELGRALAVEPFLATGVLGARLIATAGGPAELVEAALAGEQQLALAHYEPTSRYDLSHVRTRAVMDGDGWRLDGVKAVVYGGGAAERLVVSARTSGSDDAADGLTLFLVDPEATGVRRRAYPMIDGAAAADIWLDGVVVGPDAVLGTVDDGFALLEETIAAGALALSAEALGAMETAKDMTVAYLRDRKQFGRPIGSFQALQHRAVEMVIEIEQVRSAVIRAASLLDGERTERERAVSAAKSLVGRVGKRVAEECIQLHGGIAMTWEYPLGHYAKRIIMIDHQLGDSDHHLDRFVTLGRAGA